MLNFCEEANGVLSLSLYRPSACTSILRELKTRDAWEEATIRVPADPGGYSSVLLPDVRTASVMYLDGSMNVMASFAEKMRRCITPLIKQTSNQTNADQTAAQMKTAQAKVQEADQKTAAAQKEVTALKAQISALQKQVDEVKKAPPAAAAPASTQPMIP